MLADATHRAFQRYRGMHAERECDASLITHSDQIILLAVDGGRETWFDGPLANLPDRDDLYASAGDQSINLSAPMISNRRLWVIMTSEVATAEERCAFAAGLFDKVLKHSNLTGGAPAYCGGELVQLDQARVVLNGRSGRYRPRSKKELQDAAEAFRLSGYEVWSVGWDDDSDRPAPFLGKLAVRVAG